MIEKKVKNLTLDELKKMPEGSQVDLILSFRKNWPNWSLNGNCLEPTDIEHYYLPKAQEIWVRTPVPEEPRNQALVRVKKTNGETYVYHRDDSAYKGLHENTRWRLLTESGIAERIFAILDWGTVLENAELESLEILYTGDE